MNPKPTSRIAIGTRQNARKQSVLSCQAVAIVLLLLGAIFPSVPGSLLAAEPEVVPAKNEPSLAAPAAGLLSSMDALDDKQRLGIGDRVSFRIVEDREEPKPLFVTDSGELEVPYIGRMQALDKSCRALASEIKALLERDYYHRATVILAIDLLSKNRGKIYLVGQLRLSGPIDIPSDETLTLSKAILRVGGFTDFADRKRVKLTRRAATGKEQRVWVVDVAEILEKGQTDKDLKLEPDDLIFVPSRLVNF